MNCPEVTDCPCPNKKCENNGKCCACIKAHREGDSLTHCIFPDNDGNKSLEKFYHKLQARFEG